MEAETETIALTLIFIIAGCAVYGGFWARMCFQALEEDEGVLFVGPPIWLALAVAYLVYRWCSAEGRLEARNAKLTRQLKQMDELEEHWKETAKLKEAIEQKEAQITARAIEHPNAFLRMFRTRRKK